MATLKDIFVPDLGGVSNATVIEILVQAGDQVTTADSLITLESDKASMEIPAPYAGQIKAIKVKIGDKISQGGVIVQMEVMEVAEETIKKSAADERPAIMVENSALSSLLPPLATKLSGRMDSNSASAVPLTLTKEKGNEENHEEEPDSTDPHAGPSVRRLAREMGVDLSDIKGSGPKMRILKEDIEAYVKAAIVRAKSTLTVGTSLTPPLSLDFSPFGETSVQPLSKIKKLTGAHLHRNWVSIPHVTQFGEADIDDMEAFRKDVLANTKEKNLKLSPLIFAIKAVVASLQAFPQFNASLDATGENLIIKKYFHIGVAVETPHGLVVPVIRHVDQKGLLTIAKEVVELSAKARTKGLSPSEMQGGCFTISSLGGIGGTAFTPIIHAPEVAILGLSQTIIKPVYKDGVWLPRLSLPLSLSYDHRVIDGSEGARFLMHLVSRLSNIRNMLL